jgi:hypothetical protein
MENRKEQNKRQKMRRGMEIKEEVFNFLNCARDENFLKKKLNL